MGWGQLIGRVDITTIMHSIYVSFFLFRSDCDGNKEVEKILVKEVRGSFGKMKWKKAEITGW